MPYRLFIPAGYQPRQKYPLILWLHGGGARGHDNLSQIAGDQIPGTRTWTTPENQTQHPAFVVAPQTDRNWFGPAADLAIEVVETLQKEFGVDATRVYVAGQSIGGQGVWEVIAARPDLFAAAIALCPGGDVTRAAAVVTVPVWVFQGDQDIAATLYASRAMVAAIEKAGGHPRYTEYPGVDHNVWTRAFEETGLADWLFAQHK
jgi:predicted peptidase